MNDRLDMRGMNRFIALEIAINEVVNLKRLKMGTNRQIENNAVDQDNVQ
jgi:hypothetical protein